MSLALSQCIAIGRHSGYYRGAWLTPVVSAYRLNCYRTTGYDTTSTTPLTRSTQPCHTADTIDTAVPC